VSNRPSLAKTSPTVSSTLDVSTHDEGEARRIALWVAEAAIDKKAIGIEIIDVRGKIDYADFIVLMSGMSDRHVKAIADAIDAELDKKHGVQALAVEGLPSAQWVLVDLVDVVAHVFMDSVRHEYDLEGLWMDAPRVPLPKVSATGQFVVEPEPEPEAEAQSEADEGDAGTSDK
jgi:ribosome-associated protein